MKMMTKSPLVPLLIPAIFVGFHVQSKSSMKSQSTKKLERLQFGRSFFAFFKGFFYAYLPPPFLP
jgi:hypothetical protein